MAFAGGRLERIRAGEQPGSDFTLRAPPEVWRRFLQAVPPAPCHNVLAMKFRLPEFSVAGDEQKLLQFAHLVRRSLELARWVANGRDPAALRPAGPVAAAPAGSVEPIAGRYASIEIEGRAHRIYFEQAGAGRDLLFLHTAGSDTRQFHRLMNDAGLLRDWRMTAFDLPWHGKSLPPQGGLPGEWRLSTDRYVACIDAVIRGLGLKRPVLMGSSMGGQICLEMAYRFADSLGGVIACEACDKITGREVPFAKHALYNQTLAVPEWIYGLMSPTTPRARAIEIWWEYSQGGYGVFHGDIEFYAHDWDARERVARIDTQPLPGDHADRRVRLFLHARDVAPDGGEDPGRGFPDDEGPRPLPHDRESGSVPRVPAPGAGKGQKIGTDPIFSLPASRRRNLFRKPPRPRG